jgi:hypothetical protein
VQGSKPEGAERADSDGKGAMAWDMVGIFRQVALALKTSGDAAMQHIFLAGRGVNMRASWVPAPILAVVFSGDFLCSG